MLSKSGVDIEIILNCSFKIQITFLIRKESKFWFF